MTAVTEVERPGAIAVALDTANAALAPPLRVDVSWPANTFPKPMTLTVTPRAANAALGEPSTVVDVIAKDKSGADVTTFDRAITIRISASELADLPASSTDGIRWTLIPLLATPVLPIGQRDGYVRNGDGAIDIHTRHPGVFGMVHGLEVAPAPLVSARVHLSHLVLSWTPLAQGQDAIGYLIRHNGRDYRYVVGTTASLPLRQGDYEVRAVDAAGNHSKKSKTVTLARRWGMWTVRTW